MLQEIISEIKKDIEIKDYYNADKNIKLLRDSNSSDIEVDILEIKFLLEKHDFKNALLLIERVLERDKDNIEVLFMKGRIASSKGNKELAYCIFKKIRSLDNKNSDILFHLGRVAINTKRYKEARELYRELFHYSKDDNITGYFQSSNSFIISENENRIEQLSDEEKVSYGTSYYYLTNFDKAVKIFESIESINRQDKALIILCNIYRIRNQYNKALENINKAIKISENARAYYNKGLIFQEMDKADEAIKCYRKAIKIDSNYLPTYNKLYELLLKTNKYDNDIKMKLDEVLNYKFDYELSLRNMGLFFESNGDENKAIDYYNKSINYFHRFVEGYLSKILLYRKMKNYHGAFEICEKAFDATYQDNRIAFVKAILLCDVDQYSNALEWIDWTIDEENKNYKSYYYRAMCLYKLDEYSDALEYINKALDLNKRDIINWSMKIYLEYSLKKNDYLRSVREYYSEEYLSEMLIKRFISDIEKSISSLKADNTYLETINILMKERIGV